MHREAADRHANGCRRERLDLELAEIRAVERVGDVGAERLEVEVLRSAPHLLVDGEGDADGRARPLVARACEKRDRGHDLRDPRLVVGAEQCGPIARHDVVADPGSERRKSGGIENLPLVARKRDRHAVPRLVDDRRDAGADHVGRRVDMGDQPDDGSVDRARERGEDREALVELGVDESDLPELLHEQAREVELLLRARTLDDAIRPLRVHADVAEEPLEHVARELLGERAREGSPSRQARRGA